MDPKQPWINHGYRTFAYEGPTGLKVERLARQVGKSKSSFYHLFADLDING
jgi:AcrR family transcriptional regulator